MTTIVQDYERALLRIAAKYLLPANALLSSARRATAHSMLGEGYGALPTERRRQLRTAASARPGRPPPPQSLELLRLLLGMVGLHRRAEEIDPAGLERLGDAGTLANWLANPPIAPGSKLLDAALRVGVGVGNNQDRKVIDARLGRLLRRSAMAFTYDFDPRGLPPGFDTITFKADVATQLGQIVPHLQDSMTNFVLGAMSLDGFLPQDAGSQSKHILDLRNETDQPTPNLDGTKRSRRDALETIQEAFEGVRGKPTGSAYFEEFAHVARNLFSNDTDVPIDAKGLRQRVTISLSDYVAPDAGGSLNLPSLSRPETAGADLVPDNIRAVALVYAGWNLEEMKLFQVLDRVVEVFMNGQLPVGFDNGGRALSDYYFDPDEKRLSEAARRMTYSRVLGVPGGEVSREAPPNRPFQDLFLRFLATVAEYERQRRIDDVVGARGRPDVLSSTDEQVRKAGFDLAANASLYGYGGTFFVAQRLAAQIERALRILTVPEIMNAYGVQSPFQVVERVCASELGGTVPNVVRLKTMAEQGKKILDIVAANTTIWPGSDQPLFFDPLTMSAPAGGGGGLVVGPAPGPFPVDIQPDVERKLISSVEQWMAVNGIKDDQRVRLGEPEVTQPSASIPTIGNDGAGGAALDQLRQMISSGQAPSIDQLKTLVPDGGGMLRM